MQWHVCCTRCSFYMSMLLFYVMQNLAHTHVAIRWWWSTVLQQTQSTTAHVIWVRVYQPAERLWFRMTAPQLRRTAPQRRQGRHHHWIRMPQHKLCWYGLQLHATLSPTYVHMHADNETIGFVTESPAGQTHTTIHNEVRSYVMLRESDDVKLCALHICMWNRQVCTYTLKYA